MNPLQRLLPMLEDERPMAEYLPWLLLHDNGEFVLTAAGGVLRVARLDLPDFESASAETLVAHHGRLARIFERLGDGWSVWIDQWRFKAPGYMPPCDFGGVDAARRIDESRRAQFTDLARPVFQNSAFVAIHYQPQRRDAFLGWLMDRPDSGAKRHLRFFEENSGAILNELRLALRGVTRLVGDELASYLAASVSYRPGYVTMPRGALAPALAIRDWDVDAWPLRVDDLVVAAVEVRHYGSLSPVSLEVLHGLDMEARWCTALFGMDMNARRRELKELRKRWNNKLKGLGALVTEIVTKMPGTGRTNKEAERALLDLDAIEGDLAEHAFAAAHTNVYCWGKDERDVLDRAEYLAAEVEGRGLPARVATLNSAGAPLGDMPGNVARDRRNVRRINAELPLIMRASPVSGVSTGVREDWRFGGPALIAGLTRRGVPFFFSFNAPGSDVAHTALFGRTGSGKSTALALMMASFLRYPDSRAVIFDRRRSSMVTVLALGGDWVELGGGGVGVQPLRAIDRPEEMAWAHEWVLKALRQRGLEPTPQVGAAVSDALRIVAGLPPDERTLTNLWSYLGASADARTTLEHYLRHGPYGELFDGVVPGYGAARVLGIETQHITDLPEVAPLAVSAMFRAVQRDRLTGGSPKLVIVDEAWKLLQSPLFAGEIEGWARELRKLRAALVLATQSLAELDNERGRAILDQIGNHVFLPDAEATRPQTRRMYEAVGLIPEQIELLANATPKGEYLFKTEVATRLVRVHLTGDALAICGASAPADHARARELRAAGVEPGEPFTQAWLAQGTDDWLAAQRMAAE